MQHSPQTLSSSRNDGTRRRVNMSPRHGHWTQSSQMKLFHAFTYYTRLIFFFSVSQQPNSGLGCLNVEVSRSHTIRHTHTHTRQEASELMISSSKIRYLHNTQQTQENTHATDGIRTRSRSNQAPSDRRLRPPRNRDPHLTL